MIKEIPVLLLTGYLGSGKTTLVNRILTNRRGIRFAVIVNDLGEVNIDADLIQKGGVVTQNDDSLLALQNGCICCTLKMDLVKQIVDITSKNCFDYIVIEASGICEPEPIAQTLTSIPTMGYEYVKNGVARLDCIVTVVDALRLKDEFGGGDNLIAGHHDEDDLESLVIQQIEFCNIVLLNKASSVSPYERGRIKEIINALRPNAQIIECDYCDIDLDKILNTEMFDYEEVAKSAAWIREIEGHDDEDEDDDDDDHDHDEHGHHGHEEHHHGHHHHHDHDEGEAEEYGISTFVYYRREPMVLTKFDEFVSLLPKNIIRVKGICYFESEMDNCYLFEQVGAQVSLKDIGLWFATMPADELAQLMAREPQVRREWDEKYGDRMQKLVFIGQKMDIDAIVKSLDNCLVK